MQADVVQVPEGPAFGSDGGEGLLQPGRFVPGHEVEGRASQEFLRPVAQHLLHGVGSVGVAACGIHLPDPVRRSLDDIVEPLLAGLEGHAGLLACGDVLGKDDDAAHFAVRRAPGPHLPAQPLHPAVGPHVGVLLGADDLPGQAPPVRRLPRLFDIRQFLVVVCARDVRLREAEVLHPEPAGRKVAHVQVEHGQGDGCVFDEQPQLLLAGGQGFLNLLALGDVQCGPHIPDKLAYLVEIGPGAVMDPAHTAIGPDDTMLQVVFRAGLHCRGERFVQQLRVIRMYALTE